MFASPPLCLIHFVVKKMFFISACEKVEDEMYKNNIC
jgi:hypothetical protein